tara:strand:+ start:2643 stop:3470 length:828 start_codon:yes stop_codon:yes gene_type:complete
MPKIDSIIDFIKDTKGFRFDKEVAEYLGMDNRALATYKSRGELPQHYIRKLCRAYGFQVNNLKLFIENIDNYNKTVDDVEKVTLDKKTINFKKEEKEMPIEASYIIELQKEQIDNQRKELEHLKTVLNDNPLQNKQWSEIIPDFCTDVEITISAFSPKQRRITNMRGMDSIKNLLQLTDKDEKRIWREDEWFEYEEHPCNQIIEEESLRMLQKETKAMPSLLESLKFFVGNYYMGIPVIYSYNNQRVVTHCYIKIGWKLKPITIFTKNVIIKNQD